MPTEELHARMHGTTVLCVRRDNKVVMAGDGQVTMGQQVMKQSVKNTTNTMLDLSALNAGVYIIQVKAANGQWTSKVVKQN